MKGKILLPFVVILGFFALIVVASSIFVVHQTEQAIVLRFGDPNRVVTEPGLHFKRPWILEDVRSYEKRVLNFDPPEERVILSDQKPLIVDAFVRYRITDALRFKQAVDSESNVRSKLAPIVSASLRDVLGNVTLTTVLSEERAVLMNDISRIINSRATRFGIDVVDVRIGRTDLPTETSKSVYQRMRTERERDAAEFRAQGFEQSARVRAGADREATVIVAEATRESEILRGEGEAERTRILNDAFGQDPEFFDFYRSMKAYEEALANSESYMILSPDSEFFNQFGGSPGFPDSR